MEPVILRFAVERGRRSPQPAIQDALLFAEMMRRACISRYSTKHAGAATLLLVGKDDDGAPRRDHAHPYFLPFDASKSGRIDGIDIWFPKGCSHEEYTAVTSITTVCGEIADGDVFTVTFLGPTEPSTARYWKTSTPLVLERFPKVRGENKERFINSPADQVAEMIKRQFPNAKVKAEVWENGQGIPLRTGNSTRLHTFCLRRGKQRILPPAVGVTLVFHEPVTGPIVLGRLAHFGLGRFEPSGTQETIP